MDVSIREERELSILREGHSSIYFTATVGDNGVHSLCIQLTSILPTL